MKLHPICYSVLPPQNSKFFIFLHPPTPIFCQLLTNLKSLGEFRQLILYILFSPQPHTTSITLHAHSKLVIAHPVIIRIFSGPCVWVQLCLNPRDPDFICRDPDLILFAAPHAVIVHQFLFKRHQGINQNLSGVLPQQSINLSSAPSPGHHSSSNL